MLKHLIAYAGTETTFERIDRRFVEGFRTYLAKEARTKSGTALSANSQNSYFLKFKAALNRAVEEGIVPQSPAMGSRPRGRRMSTANTSRSRSCNGWSRPTAPTRC